MESLLSKYICAIELHSKTFTFLHFILHKSNFEINNALQHKYILGWYSKRMKVRRMINNAYSVTSGDFIK